MATTSLTPDSASRDRSSDPLRDHPAETSLDRVARLRLGLIREETAASLAETFRALGDPTRVRILDALGRADLCVFELAALIGLSDSAVSHQLRLLRSLRIVRPRRRGRLVSYTLDDHHIKDLFAQALRHVEEPQAVLGPGVFPAS